MVCEILRFVFNYELENIIQGVVLWWKLEHGSAGGALWISLNREKAWPGHLTLSKIEKKKNKERILRIYGHVYAVCIRLLLGSKDHLMQLSNDSNYVLDIMPMNCQRVNIIRSGKQIVQANSYKMAHEFYKISNVGPLILTFFYFSCHNHSA